MFINGSLRFSFFLLLLPLLPRFPPHAHEGREREREENPAAVVVDVVVVVVNDETYMHAR